MWAGPAGQFVNSLAKLGWTWEGNFHLRTREGLTLHLLEVDSGLLQHLLREDLRSALWRQAAQRRRDMKGLEENPHVDRLTTLKHYNSLQGKSRGLMRKLLVGAVDSRSKLFKRGMAPHDWCVFCGCRQPETLEHILWECAWWQDHRVLLQQPEGPPGPPCSALCGLARHEQRLMDARVRMSSLPERPVVEHIPSVVSQARESRDEHGRIIVFTDGACRRNSNEQLRRAGSGAYWGEQHPANFSVPLAGWSQTNQRAELYAVLRVLLTDARPVHIYSDSQYVLNGIARHHIWRGRGWKGDNSDLWERLSNVLTVRGQTLSFSKVKAHCTWTDVERGAISMFCKIGNAKADMLAVEASLEHDFHPAIVSAAAKTQEHTVALHKEMVAILEEWSMAVQELDFLYDKRLHPPLPM